MCLHLYYTVIEAHKHQSQLTFILLMTNYMRQLSDSASICQIPCFTSTCNSDAFNLCVVTCFNPHTWRAGATVEGAHGIQTLNHGRSRATAIIVQTFVHILTAVAISMPTQDIIRGNLLLLFSVYELNHIHLQIHKMDIHKTVC